jgi:hypothetical protein
MTTPTRDYVDSNQHLFHLNVLHPLLLVKSKQLSDTLKNYNGTIFDGDRVIVNTFQHHSSNLNMVDISSYHWTPSIEGTVVRLFKHGDGEQGKWYLTTLSHLDAFKSFWGSKFSFGQDWLEGMERTTGFSDFDEICNRLDPNLIYLYILPSNESNRKVCYNENMNPILLATFDKQTFQCNLHLQNELFFSNKEEVEEYVEKIDPYLYQGVIGFNITDNSVIKLESPKYTYIAKLRGNHSSLTHRYLQIRHTNMKRPFLTNFPTFDYQQIENSIDHLCKRIIDIYKSNERVADRTLHKVLRDLDRFSCNEKNVYRSLSNLQPSEFERLLR